MIKVTNIKATLADIKKDFDKIVQKSLENKAENIINVLKENTPIDTGEARDGWKFVNKTIINNVDHIAFLNQGSSAQAGSNFIEKTVLSQKGVYPSGTIVVYK